MARPPRWTVREVPRGITIVRLSSWKYFDAYIRQEMLDYQSYIWRGQRCSDWLLEPTLDRVSKRLSPKRRQAMADEHLERFKYATRGRRGLNPPFHSEVEQGVFDHIDGLFSLGTRTHSGGWPPWGCLWGHLLRSRQRTCGKRLYSVDGFNCLACGSRIGNPSEMMVLLALHENDEYPRPGAGNAQQFPPILG